MKQLHIIKIKRLLAFVTCLALLGMFIPNQTATVVTPVTADTAMTISQIQKNMGLGFNIGNALDSCDDSHQCNAQNHELEWGNPAITQAYINTLYAKGFRSIRLPVTWYEFITNDGNYTINASYLARVKEVVDYAYNKGMYVILNVHHEKWVNRSDLPTAYSSMSPQLKKVWAQIATAFSTYDQHLIFEGMNEPRAVGNASIEEWVGNTACYDVINKLNADFISTVRSIESPYKNTRMLMVPSYAASVNPSVYSAMDMSLFSDPYVAASIHAYSPYNFAMGEGDHSTFSAAYKSELDGLFTSLKTQFISKGIPVVIGEFSASNYGNLQARKDWANYYMTWTKKLGIPCFLWDNNKDTNPDPSEAHGYLNRSNSTWYSASEPVVDMLLSTLNDSSIGWKEESSYPIYKHNSIIEATAITVSQYATIDNFSSFLKAGNEIAFRYTDKTPIIAIAYDSPVKNWDGWTEIKPTDYDLENKLAYFSCDVILAAWNYPSAIDHMKLIDSDYNDLILPAYVLAATNEKVPTTTEVTATTVTTTTTQATTTTTTQATTKATTTTTQASTAVTTTTQATTAAKPESSTTTTAAKPESSTTTTAAKPESSTTTTAAKPESSTTTTVANPKDSTTTTAEKTETPQPDSSEESDATSETKDDNTSTEAISTPGTSEDVEQTVDIEVSDLIVNANYTDTKKEATYKIMGVSKEGSYMVRYIKPKKSNKQTIAVPKTVTINGTTCKVTSIAPRAFYKNKKLKKITIGANVVQIGKQAFYGCSKLNKVIMKKKVKEIGKQAFGKCKKLKKFTVGKKKISYKKFLKQYK